MKGILRTCPDSSSDGGGIAHVRHRPVEGTRQVWDRDICNLEVVGVTIECAIDRCDL